MMLYTLVKWWIAFRYTNALHTTMSKESKKQANFRLPEPLLDDLRTVSEIIGDSQTELVTEAIEEKLQKEKKKRTFIKKVEVAAA